MAHQIDPEILPPEQPQQKSLQLGPWVVPLKPKTVRALKGVAVTALLGWAGWFFQNFLQLRGVVNILASRVNLAFLWIFCFLACWLLTSGAVRKVLYRICLGVLLLVLVLCLDWWAPKPLAANPPPPFITVKVSPSAFPVSVAPRTTLYILPIHPYQTFTDAASHLHEFDNSCGEEHLWPTQEEINSKPPNGYEEVRRIEVTNHSQDAIESGRIAFSVLYNEAFGGGCMSPPASSAPQEDVIFVPAIDPGKSFEFVAVNQTNRCAWLIAPTTIRIRKANDATPINAPLKLEPTVVSTWLSSPFGPTTIKWVGVPIKNPGYGIARSGASCQSANEITHNTFPEMDVTTTEKSQGNKLQDNLFKNPVVPGQMPTAKNGSGANTAEIYKAQTRNQYPGGFPDTPWPIANTVLHGTNASVIDQLDHLIDEAHKIVADFRKDHNAQSIQEREKTWEAESTSALKANLGQSFAEEFDEKELASDPNRLNTEGSKICNLIDAKIDVLSIFANQLGATNH